MDQTNPQAAPPAAPAHPDFTKPPASAPAPQQPQAPAPEQAPATIPLTIDEYQRLRGVERQFADFQAQQQKAMEDARNAEIKALADKGEVEKALEAQRSDWEKKHAEATQRYREIETLVFDEKADAVLADVLAGQVFAGQDDAARAAASKMLRTHLRGEIEARRDASGSIVVVDKASGRPAAEVLRQRLSDPTLAFFFAPNSRGGSGADGTRPPANPQQPTFLQKTAEDHKARQGQYPSFGLHALT